MDIPIIFPIIWAIILPILVLSWYQLKEKQDLEAIEFKILAAENNLEYQEDGKDYLSRLSCLDLLPGKPVQITNVVSRQHGAFRTRIFKASHVIGSSKLRRIEYLVGVAVEFENIVLPRFELEGTDSLGRYTAFDRMAKVKYDLLPDWLKDNCSLIYDRNSLSTDVIDLFQDKEELLPFLDRSHFHLLVGNNKTIVYYCKGEIGLTLDFYYPMEDIGLTIARLFDPSLNSSPKDAIPEEIKQLKENEKK